MWQRSAPSNQTTPTLQHDSQVEDSPSDPPNLLVEETLESQAEYPREVAEEVEEEEVEEVEVEEEEVEEEEVEEDSLLQHRPHKQLLIKGINLLATHHSLSQEIEQNQKHS